MEPTEKELEDRLKDLGIRLASPPSGVDELLRLLDSTEIYLSRVEQSPSTSMSDALRPTMDSLVTKEYLNHPETDVKVFVAACINEITRITAPDAPYNDSLMKEIFAVIVDAFGKLDDISGPSYAKRVSILETVAKVRSCVVMLDLECDDLILLMFKYFLNCIRPEHSINVFSSMETIMTLVLEDSEDISQELLNCLLSSIHKSKKDVMPVACRLAEKVISNCAMKLKPYILVAVKSSGAVTSDYGEIVASICHECSVASEQNEVDDSTLLARVVPDELPQASDKLDKHGLEEHGAADKARKVLSNGVVPFENGNPIAETNSPEIKPENYFSSEQCRDGIAKKVENNKLSTTEKPGNELDLKSVEAKSSSVQLTDASDSSRVDGDKEASSPTIRRAGRKRKTKSNMKSDGAFDMLPETEVLLEPKKMVELQPLEGLVGDSIPVTASDNVTNNSKMDEAARSQFSTKKRTTLKAAPSASNKKRSRNTTMVKAGPLDIVSERKEDHFAAGNSSGKPSQDTTEKSLEDNATAVHVAEKSSMKEQNESLKKDAVSISSRKRLKSSFKQPKDKDATEGDVSAEKSFKELVVPSKALKEASNHSGKVVETSSVKKRQRKTSGWRVYTGRRIEVWWPDDLMFYKGVIAEFDPVTEKHKVVYDDGDVEFLLLANERWNYIDSNNLEKNQENEVAIPEPSVQAPRKQRGSSRKSKVIPERDGSVGEFKGSPVQQPRGGKSRGRPKQETPKVGTPPLEKTPASDGTMAEQFPGGKSAVKSRGRSKQETSKSGASPTEKSQVSYGSDENSHGGKSSVKSRRRPRQDASKLGADEETKGTRTSDAVMVEEAQGEKTDLKPRGRHRKETSEAAPSLPDDRIQETRASDGTKLEESHDGKTTVKSKGRSRQKTSKAGISPVEKTPEDGTNKVNSDVKVSGTNKSPPSAVGKSGIRSRRRSKGEKNELETATESPPAKVSVDDTPQDTSAGKDTALASPKLGGRSSRRPGHGRGRRTASVARGKPKTSSISTQTETSDFPPTDTPGSVINEKPLEPQPLESGKDAKVREKRKETPSAVNDAPTDASASPAIKISEGKDGADSGMGSDAGAPKRGAAKSNKRRRRK